MPTPVHRPDRSRLLAGGRRGGFRRTATAASLGSVLAIVVAVSASGAPALAPPKFARSVDIGLVSGVVIVKPVAGRSFRLGTQDRTIPVGSELDTSQGEVDLRSALDPRKAQAVSSAPAAVQDGQFRGGLFRILQRPSQRGLTVLDLLTTRTMRQVCASASAAASPGRLSRRVLQTLRAHDSSGNFRTRGRYSSATVRGTIWSTTERCDGTLTAVQRGTVDVFDFARQKTIVVHAGGTYLARASG